MPRQDVNTHTNLLGEGSGQSPAAGAAVCSRQVWRCPLWVITGHFAAFNGCLLYPRKRTSFGTAAMTVPCHKRTSAELLDHVIGAGEHSRRNVDA